MLDALRRSASSWIIKILFVILILSFGVWGIADYIKYTSLPKKPAIIVGDIPISIATVQEEFNSDVSQLRTITGRALTIEDARQMGVAHKTIDRLVSAAALDMAARIYRLEAPDELLVTDVSRRQEFQDMLGRFDRAIFRRVIAAGGQSEDVYFEHLRQQILRAQVSSAVTAGVIQAPESEVNYLYQHHYEQRVAEVVAVPVTSVPLPSVPDQEVLEDFYKTHITDFTTPEYRTISAILLTKSAIASLVSIPDEMIRQTYNDSLQSMHTPEIRTIELYQFANLDQAATVLEQVKKGRSLVQAAADIVYQMTPIEQRLSRLEMEPVLAEAVFTAPLDTISGPVYSALGWYIFRVTTIEPEVTQPLENVSDQIRYELLSEEVDNVLYELTNKVENALNKGISLENAAAQAGLAVTTFVPMDRSGLDINGKTVPDLPPVEEFLSTAFAITPGGQSPMIESSSGYLVIRVDRVNPQHPQPMGDVYRAIVAQWMEIQRRQTARYRAELIMGYLRDGLPLHEAARDSLGSIVSTSKAITRTSIDDRLPKDLIDRIFHLKIGETVINETNKEFIIARLQKIIVASTVNPIALLKLQEDLKYQYTADIFTQFTAAIRQKFNITVSPQALEVP